MCAPIYDTVERNLVYETMEVPYSLGKLPLSFTKKHFLFSSCSVNKKVSPKLWFIKFFILFISSHGDTRNSKFYIKGSDFNEDSFLKTTISYGEMVRHLNSFSGKKTIWLDACKSGAGVQTAFAGLEKGNKEALAAKAALTKRQKAVSSALHNIIDSQEGIITLTSSKAEENSYECHDCKNGVFTHALLKGLRLADADNNSIIYIDELYKYIREEMPNIINNQVYKILPVKKRPSQTPMLRNKIGNIPIFMLN